MGRHLRRFEDIIAYNTERDNLDKPCVSLIKDTMKCKYDQLPRTLYFVHEGNFEDPSNWNLNKLPKPIDNIVIQADCTCNSIVSVNSISIEEEGILSVMPFGGLVVGSGGISGSTTENLILKAGTEGAIKGQTGFLKISPEYTGEMPETKIEMFSIGYYNKELEYTCWQKIGSPIDFKGALAKTVFTRSYLYSYIESTDSWINNRSRLVMEPFIGYNTAQFDSIDGLLICYAGQLINNRGVVDINLEYTDGENLGHNILANSFSAPIDVSNFQSTDFINATPQITISITSSNKEPRITKTINITNKEDIISQCTIAGISPIIPSMQGFWVNAAGPDAKLILDYDRLVWNGNNINGPLL